ncbi:PQQ-dependent sugar dehydrogenase [Candidatus Roizmanbacteria bacterium]|nr:PQQ-dependent sugar dehydrogenase [Candidatus Roizmanbacteria bacterium]
MSRLNITILALVGIFILISGFTYLNLAKKESLTTSQPLTDYQTPTDTNQDSSSSPRLSIVAGSLEVPWALAFLPDKSILFTEREGRVRLIDSNGNLNPNPLLVLDDVKQISESGLHGIAIHPNFSGNQSVYLYYTYEGNENQTLNRVVRFKFENNVLSEKTIIVDQIPGAPNHDGGRIKFGPDKLLYITTGDAQNPSLSQNTNSLAGKILRVTDDGKPAPGNPFGNEVLSYGHRNPQGITWDNEGRLWETEHGQSATDELNLIEGGKNYGWPDIRGDQAKDGMEIPILHSGSDTWAPGGAAFINGSIFFAGLRGQTLYEAVINDANVTLKEHFKGELGRIREVVVGPDNMLYITTSNRDGRGNPNADDDKIIRVNPEKL